MHGFRVFVTEPMTFKKVGPHFFENSASENFRLIVPNQTLLLTLQELPWLKKRSIETLFTVCRSYSPHMGVTGLMNLEITQPLFRKIVLTDFAAHS